jgi:ATP-binding cassette subfamily B protein
MLAGSLMLIISAGAMLTLPQYLKQMFDAALHTGNSGQLAKLAALMFATVLVMVASIFLRTRLIANSGNNLLATLRNRLSQHLLNQDTTFFETRASGAIVSRLTADPFALREFLNLAAPQLVRGLVLGVGTLGVLLYTSPSLTVLLLAAAAPIGIAGKIIGAKIRITARQVQDNLALYGAHIEETVTNIRTIHAFSQQPRLLAAFEEQANQITRIANRRALLSAAFVATNVIIGFSALIAVVWLGGLRVMHGTMSLGDMMAFLLYLAFLADAVGNITNFWPAWQATLGATERIIELLNQHPKITSPAKPQSLPEAKNGRTITLHNVAYAYPSRPETDALAGLTLTIPAGKHIAIVGPSGAGKSTLFRLILRLDDPTHGHLELDGTPLKKLALNTLRTQFALVAQESPLFSGTVLENVAFGAPDASENAIWRALRTAHAEAFVKALPRGLKTQVGEKGVQLSGGQKQRLAIARAILTGAPVLLLDEATSHLDSESEKAIQDALTQIGKNKTVITIAHRLSTVKSADEILVFDKGTLAAQGTHEKLLKSSKLYNALATLQLQA